MQRQQIILFRNRHYDVFVTFDIRKFRWRDFGNKQVMLIW